MKTHFDIREDDLTNDQTRDLLAFHLRRMQAGSPVGSVHALELSALKTPEVTVWSAWRGIHLASIGALKMLGRNAAEIKSMRTHPDFLRMGAGAAILDHLIDKARERQVKRLSLETGSGPAFEAALAMYRRRGFVEGESFAHYKKSDFNRFLHLSL